MNKINVIKQIIDEAIERIERYLKDTGFVESAKIMQKNPVVAAIIETWNNQGIGERVEELGLTVAETKLIKQSILENYDLEPGIQGLEQGDKTVQFVESIIPSNLAIKTKATPQVKKIDENSVLIDFKGNKNAAKAEITFDCSGDIIGSLDDLGGGVFKASCPIRKRRGDD